MNGRGRARVVRGGEARRRGLTRPGARPAARELVHWDFTAVAPDVLWCGDVTQIDTEEGSLHLATVGDLFSRRMLGRTTATATRPRPSRRCRWPPSPAAGTSTGSSFTLTAAAIPDSTGRRNNVVLDR
ncbi:hypothetical protein GCM10009753_58630 [Streptantibioticus ferralitis]